MKNYLSEVSNAKFVVKDYNGIVYKVPYFELLGTSIIYTLESIGKEVDIYTYELLESDGEEDIVSQYFMSETMVEAFECMGYEVIKQRDMSEELKKFIETYSLL